MFSKVSLRMFSNIKQLFTPQQIHDAHAKVKTGADFPRYVQDLKKLGVLRYDFIVENGAENFFGKDNFTVKLDPKYTAIKVADNSSAEKLKEVIKIHQQGKTDFPTFCKQSAEVGVEKWITDLGEMKCIYVDKKGKELVSEDIPKGDY